MAQDMDLSWICCLQTVGSSAAFIYLFSTSSMLLVPYSQLFVLSPPSAVKKESLSSISKEGNDSSESGESLVIGGSFSLLSNNFRAMLLVSDS